MSDQPETSAPYVHWVAPAGAPRVPQVEIPPGWTRPRPEIMPRATNWPSVLAFGVILIVWGPVSSWVIALVGVVLAAFAVGGWIRELLHEAETRR